MTKMKKLSLVLWIAVLASCLQASPIDCTQVTTIADFNRNGACADQDKIYSNFTNGSVAYAGANALPTAWNFAGYHVSDLNQITGVVTDTHYFNINTDGIHTVTTGVASGPTPAAGTPLTAKWAFGYTISVVPGSTDPNTGNPLKIASVDVSTDIIRNVQGQGIKWAYTVEKDIYDANNVLLGQIGVAGGTWAGHNTTGFDDAWYFTPGVTSVRVVEILTLSNASLQSATNTWAQDGSITQTTPEPMTALLLGFGLTAFGLISRRSARR